MMAKSSSYEDLNISDVSPVSYRFPTAVPNQSNPQSRSLRFGKLKEHLWVAEICSWLASILFLFTIAATLKHSEGKPLSSWPLYVTLNALISVLSVAMKATMLLPLSRALGQLKWSWFTHSRLLEDFQTFDRASRGVWGSVLLLGRTKICHFASLGALITILAVTLDPFVQQIVLYPQHNVAQNDLATVPRAQGYAVYTKSHSLESQGPGFSMTTAIFNGFSSGYLNSDVLQATPRCATGDCTFSEPYSSLAVCSKCLDVTSSLVTNEHSPGFCNSILPNEASLHGNALMNSSTDLDLVLPANMNFGTTTIANISIITAATSSGDVQDRCDSPVATQCVLYWCVNTYTGRVSSGIWSETLSTSWTSTTTPKSFVAVPNVLLSLPSDSSNGRENNTFTLDWFAWLGMRLVMPIYLTGTVSLETGKEHATSEFLQAFWDQGNAARTMQNLAIAMTQEVRRNPVSYSDSDTFAKGLTWAPESYVNVRWVWLALPILLEILTALFLALTIFETRVAQVPIWKSSTLPVLRCQLRGRKVKQLYWTGEAYKMEGISKRIETSLRHQDGETFME